MGANWEDDRRRRLGMNGNLVVVKNEKGELQVEKQKWSTKHKEVVDSLDIGDEEVQAEWREWLQV